MIGAALTRQDIAAVGKVSESLGLGFIAAANTILQPIADDLDISPQAMLLGIAQAHINGLATILNQLDDKTRDLLIVGVPAQLHAIIARGQS